MPYHERNIKCNSCIKEMRKKGKSLKEITHQCRLVKHCTKRNLDETDLKESESENLQEEMDKRKSTVHLK